MVFEICEWEESLIMDKKQIFLIGRIIDVLENHHARISWIA
jgi:hypothetical protein